MLGKNDIKVGNWYTSKAYGIIMELKSFESGHEPHLGLVKLKFWEWSWSGSLREFRLNFNLKRAI